MISDNENANEIIDLLEDGEIVERLPADLELTSSKIQRPSGNEKALSLVYIILPLIFLLVTLLGGLRFGAVDNSFIFLKPPLVCLVFAAITLILFARSRLVEIGGWFAEDLSTLQSTANAAVLLTLFTATTQLYNSLLPEQGLPFWVVGFCFVWTLWNNLFSEFDNRRLIRSLGALFALAFVVKYLVLANLTAPSSEGWFQRIIANPGKEAFTYLLDLPQYAAATGYVQFVTITLYLIGLLITPRSTKQ